MRRLFLPLVLLFAPALLSAPVSNWITVGPPRGSVSAIASSMTDDLIVAGTAQGLLFCSEDGGQSWNLAGRGLGGQEVRRVEIGRDSSRVWTLTDVGLYRSNDRASTFQSVRPGVASFVVAPSDANVVYATDGISVVTSNDAGETWQSAAGTGLPPSVTSIAVDASNPALVWAAARVGGTSSICRSSDGAKSWQTAFTPPDVQIVSVIAHPFRSGTVFAAPEMGPGYRTTDGLSWTRLEFLPGKLFFDGRSDQRFFLIDQLGRVWRTANNADSLYMVHAGFASAVAFERSNPSTVYIGLREFGVMRSDDNGDHWSTENTGLIAAESYSIAVSPLDERVMYVSGLKDVVRTMDGGATWKMTFTLRSLSGPAAIIAMDPRDPASVWFGSQYTVFHTLNDGTIWHEMGSFHGHSAASGILNDAMTGLQTDPQHPGTVWLTMSGNYASGTQGELYRSSDHGQSFTDETPQLSSGAYFLALYVDPDETSSMWIGGALDRTHPLLLHSTDGGRSWSDLSASIAAIDASSVVTAIYVDPRNRGLVFAGATSPAVGARIFRSDDGGATWHASDSGIAAAGAAITSIILSGNSLYAAAAPRRVGTVDITPAGSANGGLFVSDDGAHWQSASASLGSTPFMSLSGTRTLFAATLGRGVFAQQLVKTPKARAVRP